MCQLSPLTDDVSPIFRSRGLSYSHVSSYHSSYIEKYRVRNVCCINSECLIHCLLFSGEDHGSTAVHPCKAATFRRCDDRKCPEWFGQT